MRYLYQDRDRLDMGYLYEYMNRLDIRYLDQLIQTQINIL